MSSQNYGIPAIGAAAGTVPSANSFTNNFTGIPGEGVETDANGSIAGSLLEPHCIQTKFLPADVANADAFLTALEFNNLTVGNHYQLFGSFYFYLTTSDGSAGARIYGVDPSSTLFSRFGVNPIGASPQLSNAEGQFGVVTPIFQAFQTNIQFEAIFLQTGDQVRGNGTYNETWFQLIEYKRIFNEVTSF